ncbi:unnamed protein product [Discosporangium mesarthrocarpum]
MHEATSIFEVFFPGPGALGLNLISLYVQLPAGARPGLPVFGCLEVLEAQHKYLQVVVQPGDILLSVNGTALCGENFNFEAAISQCSKAPPPRTLRFVRMKNHSPAEVTCALKAQPSAIFDAVPESPPQLVTAHLHPQAPPFFNLNPPTRQEEAAT